MKSAAAPTMQGATGHRAATLLVDPACSVKYKRTFLTFARTKIFPTEPSVHVTF
ncbi:MAG: hypothetical protein ABSG04_14760 [Verrucomicrobiota bacterium]